MMNYRKSKYPLLMVAMVVTVAGFFIAQSGVTPGTESAKIPAPSDAGTNNGVPYRTAGPDSNLVVPKMPGPLRVDRLDLWRLKAGTVIGKDGDWAMVLHGSGFFEAEFGPLVHLGKEITLERTVVNQDGSELYVVIPAETMVQVKKFKFKELAVQNPSGLDRDPARWGRLEVDPKAFVAAMDSARDARFNRGTYFPELER